MSSLVKVLIVVVVITVIACGIEQAEPTADVPSLVATGIAEGFATATAQAPTATMVVSESSGDFYCTQGGRELKVAYRAYVNADGSCNLPGRLTVERPIVDTPTPVVTATSTPMERLREIELRGCGTAAWLVRTGRYDESDFPHCRRIIREDRERIAAYESWLAGEQ